MGLLTGLVWFAISLVVCVYWLVRWWLLFVSLIGGMCLVWIIVLLDRLCIACMVNYSIKLYFCFVLVVGVVLLRCALLVVYYGCFCVGCRLCMWVLMFVLYLFVTLHGFVAIAAIVLVWCFVLVVWNLSVLVDYVWFDFELLLLF